MLVREDGDHAVGEPGVAIGLGQRIYGRLEALIAVVGVGNFSDVRSSVHFNDAQTAQAKV